MAIRMPISTDPTASGTIAYQPVRSMAIQAARTVSAFAVVTAETPRTRYATTAPIHPIENRDGRSAPTCEHQGSWPLVVGVIRAYVSAVRRSVTCSDPRMQLLHLRRVEDGFDFCGGLLHRTLHVRVHL